MFAVRKLEKRGLQCGRILIFLAVLTLSTHMMMIYVQTEYDNNGTKCTTFLHHKLKFC